MTEHYFSADPSVPFEREAFTAELAAFLDRELVAADRVLSGWR